MKPLSERNALVLKSAFLFAIYMLGSAAFAVCFGNEIQQAPVGASAILFFLSVLINYLYSAKRVAKTLEKQGQFTGVVGVILSSLLSSVALVYLYQGVRLGIAELSHIVAPDNLVRIYLLFWAMVIVNAYAVYDVRKVTDFLFTHRWWIAVLTILILVVANINFSNIACFSYSIQPDSVTPFSEPLFGTPRNIRSDEWLVTTPRKISAEYSNYGKFNYIARATMNYNIGCADLYRSYSALVNPLNWGYYLFGSEYGASFFWSTFFVLSIMLGFEFSYLISNRNRLIGVLGVGMLSLSQFFLWWSMVCHIPAMQAIIVCAIYFFESKKRWKKTLLALGIAFAGSTFISNLYPAWQVPMAYVLIALFAWVFITHAEDIKKLKCYDWLIIMGAFLFMCSTVAAYLYNSQEYNAQLMATVYPGARFHTGGGTLDGITSYIAGLIFPLKDTGNNSEASTFFNLFPLPMLYAAGLVVKDIVVSVKEKRYCVDTFNLLLLVPTMLILVYCTTGLPYSLAKYTLMSYSTQKRALDILGLVNAYFLIRIAGDAKRDNKLPLWAAIAMILAELVYAIRVTERKYPEYMPFEYIVCVGAVVLVFGLASFSRIGKKLKTLIIVGVAVVLILSGMLVLPITRGMDSIFAKPVSYAVQEIVEEDPDGKWIACDDIISPQFLIANGAPTINSTNYVPNIELWNKLDPKGTYDEVYNRYSHVRCVFTENETRFELLSADYMKLHLSYSDFSIAEIKYVYSSELIEEASKDIDLQLLYSEGGSYIYRVHYLR